MSEVNAWSQYDAGSVHYYFYGGWLKRP